MANQPLHRLRALSFLVLVILASLGLFWQQQSDSPAPKPTASAPQPLATVPQAPALISVAAPETPKNLTRALADMRAGRGFTLREHGHTQTFRLALDEIYEPTASVHERLKKITPLANSTQLLDYAAEKATQDQRWPGLVIYGGDGQANKANLRVLTGQVLIQTQDVKVAESAVAAAGLKITNRPSYAPDHLVAEATSPLLALEAMEKLSQSPEILSAEPLLMRHATRKVLLNDPLFPQQFHLKNNGQFAGKKGIDIGVTDVWDEFQGQGIRIAIVDDGLQIAHPDLAPNADTANHFDWNDTPPDTNPAPDRSRDYHGTAVGGLAAARGDNELGVSGAAPQATLVGYRLIAGLVTDETTAEAAVLGSEIIQIKNNSWGMEDGYPSILTPVGALTSAAMELAAINGRGGRGTISVWSAGNGRGLGDQGNKDAYSNSIYGITVGAVTNRGLLTSYSETGSHLCVVAPSAELRTHVLVTTDLAGFAGYNNGLNLKNYADVDYTNDFNGTSAAAPLVSGVIALMLQANPSLGWRDVKEILLRSSTEINPGAGWVKRGGGYVNQTDLPPIKHHHFYGGGLINAKEAVRLAKSWINLGPLKEVNVVQAPAATSLNLTKGGTPISVIEDPVTRTTRVDLDFSGKDPIRVEHVKVRLSIEHANRGEMTLQLVSPSGTSSVLANASEQDFGANYENWTFSSLRHWGESSRGIWSLLITETKNSTDGTFIAANVTLFGSEYPDITLAAGPETVLLPLGSPLTLTGTTSFSAPPTRTPIVTQQWQKEGKNIPGATTRNLSFTALKLTDAGIYTYNAQNLTGKISASSGLGIVNVSLPSQSALAGRTVTFKISSAGPLLRYQWFIGSRALSDDGRITGSRSPTLTLRNISVADADDYYCRVSMLDLFLNSQRATLSLTVPPSVAEIIPPANGIISGNVNYLIQAENLATRYTATGLPPGLRLDPLTGRVTGRPTKAGIYSIVITASNAAGSSAPRTVLWEIEPLPDNTVGSYRGLLSHDLFTNGGYGGLLTLTITPTGNISGVLTRGIYRTAFTGALDTLPGGPLPTATLSIPRANPNPPLTLSLTFDSGDLSGTLSAPTSETATLGGLRLWTTPSQAYLANLGRYNLALEAALPSTDLPGGLGHLSAVLSPQGSLTYTGKLADGTAITGSSLLGITPGEGEILLPIHHMLYEYSRGSVQGVLSLAFPSESRPRVQAELDWVKSAVYSTSTSRSYRSGFVKQLITGSGPLYTPPAGGRFNQGLTFATNLSFSSGGLAQPFSQSLTLLNGITPTFPTGSSNPHQLSLSINAATGHFTGRGIAMDIDPTNPLLRRGRPGTFSGVLVNGTGLGHFLLPTSTQPTSPILSGRVDWGWFSLQ